MKFTEGYWCRSKSFEHHYASQAFDVEEMENGMRVYAPFNVIKDKGDTLNLGMLTIEFTSVNDGVIGVRIYHHVETKKDKRFIIEHKPENVNVEINDKEAILTSGDVKVRVNRESFSYSFEANGKVLTSSGFRGLGYYEQFLTTPSMLPGDNYMTDNKRAYIQNELEIAVGECIYGFGERFSAFVKNGQQLETWNEDGGTSSPVAYKAIPFYMTNKGYGILVDHSDNVSFEVGSEKVERVGFSVEGEELRYFLVYGPTPEQIVKNYTNLTGRPTLPPAWSFGLWLTTSFTTSYDEKTVSSMIGGMAERDVPLHVFSYDCCWMREFNWCDFVWDERVFPDPKAMLERQKANGLKICCWINPYISGRSAIFNEAMEKGYLLMRADGRGPRQMDTWQAGMAIVDFTNPDAYAWYQGHIKKLIATGVDCFKTDFGERIPVDVRWFDGSDPNSMHNFYPYLYNKCVVDAMKPEKDPIVFARSATVGSQIFPVHWGGDNTATYASMAETLRSGLSFALCGFGFWSHDIAGFENVASPAIYKRWSAFGMLSSHSRLHGSSCYKVPWLFGEEAVDVLRYFIKLKCKLMPYLFQMATVANTEGVPMMRPMMFAYPNDQAATYLDRQYMLGDNLLVAPVFSDCGDVEYYLPHGTWTHLLNGKSYEGGRWLSENYDFMSLPLLVKENTILPLGYNSQKPDYDYENNLELHVYSLGDGKTATCNVPDLEGKTTLSVSATRTGNEIAFVFSKVPLNAVVVIDGQKYPVESCAFTVEVKA